jgi:hypothetical protein
LQWVIGQGYDGAGNVRGKCSGLKSRIQQMNKKALYVWCYGHRFNLVIEATVACNAEVKNALGLLEELYVFFIGHKRNAQLMAAQSGEHKRQLKRVVCTRWNSKESAVNTTLDCFSAILSTLDDLAANGDDSATVTGARGLSARLRDYRFIITIFVLKEVFEVAGPASRQLQAVSMDLAMAAQLVSTCRAKFASMRSDSNVNNLWLQILTKANSFARENGINTNITERQRSKKRMAGEQTKDLALTGEERLRVFMFLPVLDELCMQMDDRFGGEQIALMHEMSLFASGSLRPGSEITSADIYHLTETYNFDAEALVPEYRDFCNTYSQLKELNSRMITIVNDVGVRSKGEIEENNDHGNNESDESDDDDEIPDESIKDTQRSDLPNVQVQQQQLHSFIGPLKVLTQLSGYPNLLRVYWILATLPVTSCSAERALSRLRIIKNRLRSTMCDDWMKSLMIIAAEKDLLSTISNNSIIDAFASLNDRLRRNLICI